MKRRLTKRMKTGALALAGLQILACGAPLEPEAPAAVSQVSQALTPTGVTTVANVTYPAILDQHITNALVDRQRVPDELLRPNVIPDLRVADSSYCNVTVSFHSELALQRNALGYFVYPDGQPPTTRPTTAQLQQNIIFPNTSAQGSNGTLVKGNARMLGTGTNNSFSKGQRIGFFLVADGCNSDTGCTATNLDYTKPVYYSVDALNPETTNKRHALIVSDAEADRLVLGFEDVNRDRTTDPVSDHDFNDVLFVIQWQPAGCIEVTQPQIDPDASCQAVKLNKNYTQPAPSGWYKLDPCGPNGEDKWYYCDMDTTVGNIKGGWTWGGIQPANATTPLGTADRNVPTGTTRPTTLPASYSQSLKCLPFSEAMVFNRTYNEFFTQTISSGETGNKFNVTTTPFAVGPAGNYFVQGTNGSSPGYDPMMGCVSYNFQGYSFLDNACATQTWVTGNTARGHIAGEALPTNCNPALDAELDGWAWANNSTCKYAKTPYTWGIAIR